MKDSQKDLLEKAKQSLDAAKKLLDNGYPSFSVSRSYSRRKKEEGRRKKEEGRINKINVLTVDVAILHDVLPGDCLRKKGIPISLPNLLIPLT
jgi:hypothetical protein